MMKKSTKLIAILTVTVLLTALLVAAIADDKIFTSSIFSIPKSRIDSEMLEAALKLKEESESAAEAENKPAEEEAEEDSKSGKPKKQGKKRQKEDAETEPEEPVGRQVKIFSSRKDIVIKNEIITLSSELIGFDDVVPHYQWQVDRGDGKGWVDVEGATNPKHEFIARPDTILYNWRLSVTVDE